MAHKTKVAFEMSVDRMFDVFTEVYMWTLTFKDTMPDWRYPVAYDMFMTELQNRHGKLIQGLRVIEVHPGGHGLHYHLLVQMRVGVRLVRQIGKKYGIGRVHVTRCNNRDQGKYLAKYLGKKGLPLTEGMRRWGTIGGFRQCRVANIEVDSIFHRNCAKLFGGSKRTIQEINYVYQQTMLHGNVTEWPEYLHKYNGDPVWTPCPCKLCSRNRRARETKRYYLDTGKRAKRKHGRELTFRPKLPERKPRGKSVRDLLVEDYVDSLTSMGIQV